MQKHYKGLTERMLSEISSISDSMSHQGEKGRNNELVLKQFLEQHLAKRYTVSTGKVLSANGSEGGQIDLIIHDRLDTPELVEGRAFRLVPVETVYAVISVKTTLTRGELQDAMHSIASVRSLPRTAAVLRHKKGRTVNEAMPEANVLRARGFVFGFKSSWASPDSANTAFLELLADFDDSLRPNAICILDQCLIPRKPYTTSTKVFTQYALMHFFVFLSQSLERFPKYSLDLSQYFREDYEQSAGGA
jgi:hypothetical protein